jgi:hypothetical protein
MQRPPEKLLLVVENNPALATQLAQTLLAQREDTQVIVASDCVTALRVPSLMHASSYARGREFIDAQRHRSPFPASHHEKPPGLLRSCCSVQISLEEEREMGGGKRAGEICDGSVMLTGP